jgi:hypothetical protein
VPRLSPCILFDNRKVTKLATPNRYPRASATETASTPIECNGEKAPRAAADVMGDKLTALTGDACANLPKQHSQAPSANTP